MKIKLFILSICLSNTVWGQMCHCDSVFLSVKTTVEQNYAGWFDKVNNATQRNYDELSNNTLQKTALITQDSLCSVEIKSWLTFFKDKHLRLRYAPPRQKDEQSTDAAKPLEILKTEVNETAVMQYFKTQKSKDAIEGIWESANYKLGIVKAKKDVFYATVLTTQNDNWKSGDVKLIITKQGKTYKGTFFEGDKSDKSEHNVKIVDNILDFDIVYFEKIFPAPAQKRNLVEYEIQQDKQAPKLDVSNPMIARFTFPNFYGNSEEQLETLLKMHKDKLATIPYWIVDLRDNDGGDYRVGMQLLPYIYSQPIVKYNAKTRVTTSNIDKWFNAYLKDYYDGADKATKALIDEKIRLAKAHTGEMFDEGGETDTIKLDNVRAFPKKVAFIINDNTVSSGELFTMLARQSQKATVYGKNSGGMMDYGDLISYTTPCATIRLTLPINRFNWLDTGFSVDKEGLKPDVYLKEPQTEWLKIIADKLTKSKE